MQTTRVTTEFRVFGELWQPGQFGTLTFDLPGPFKASEMAHKVESMCGDFSRIIDWTATERTTVTDENLVFPWRDPERIAEFEADLWSSFEYDD